MTTVTTTDDIQEALNELLAVGIIIEHNEEWVRLDTFRLNSLGYMLIFRNDRPEFITNADFNYTYNYNIYLSNIIPKSSLQTLKTIQLKMGQISP